MKKIILFFVGVTVLFASSCSDMLNVDSDRYIANPDMNKKTDSLFYAWGIMQAMQQAADIYVLQNEMRGDLVTATSSANTDLKALADFSATTGNRYDSAYVFYKVINNCNYYLAHRDTTLMNGSINVTTQEYAAVMAFRAWAYLQLARQYGKVPFFTEPLANISQVDNNSYPMYGISEITDALAPSLEKYSGQTVPSYGSISMGNGTTVNTKICYIPVDVILGELYLEKGGSRETYLKAAKSFYNYLYQTQSALTQYRASFDYSNLDMSIVPSNFGGGARNATSWNNSFRDAIVTAIPMAVSQQKGKTSNLPELFGYDYYSIDASGSGKYIEDGIQLLPSSTYNTLADSSDYYYVKYPSDGLDIERFCFKAGDMRRWNRLNTVRASQGDSTMMRLKLYTGTYTQNNIYIDLYRLSGIWLNLAEAFNRAGYPDAAFAILKDGMTEDLINVDNGYITEETKQLLTTEIPFLSESGKLVFTKKSGIHGFGCSDDKGIEGTYSKYQMDTIVVNKVKELAEKFPGIVTVPETESGTAADIMAELSTADIQNAVEDILCDEYAMEMAFEGRRFFDLNRMARHKAENEGYPSDFGGQWFAKKLSANKPVKDLTIEENRYLPFK